jgi:hypothetical protein
LPLTAIEEIMGGPTVTEVEPEICELVAVAVIVHIPCPTLLTSPLPLTVAIALLDELQATLPLKA